MLTIFCYECEVSSTESDKPMRWVCALCEPKLCKNDECWASAWDNGLCEGCDEIGFVNDRGEFELFDDEDGDTSDMSADAEWLASAGWGTDEDYGG